MWCVVNMWKKENMFFKSCDGKIVGNFEIMVIRLLEIENVLIKKIKWKK